MNEASVSDEKSDFGRINKKIPRQYIPLLIRIKVFLQFIRSTFNFLWNTSSGPPQKTRDTLTRVMILGCTDIERCRIELLIEFESSQLDRPLGDESTIDRVD